MARLVWIEGQAGKAAIYDADSIDDSWPLFDPYTHATRLHFHSDLPSPAIVRVNGQFANTGVLVLPQQNRNSHSSPAYNLFAHGRPGTPMVFGKINVNGVEAPLNGSVPFVLNTSVQIGVMGFGRWAHLGADATNVIIRVSSMAGDLQDLAPISVAWEVYVTDVTFEGAVSSTGDSTLCTMEPNYFSVGGGKFRSDRRYVRRAGGTPRFYMVQGHTVEMNAPDGQTGGPNVPAMSIRYSVAGFTTQAGVNPPNFAAAATGMDF